MGWVASGACCSGAQVLRLAADRDRLAKRNRDLETDMAQALSLEELGAHAAGGQQGGGVAGEAGEAAGAESHEARFEREVAAKKVRAQDPQKRERGGAP